ncbi:MAG: hypothetical protein ABFS35_18975 [Bacteroidota bacterium]
MNELKKINAFDDLKQYLNISSKKKVLLLIDLIRNEPELTKQLYELAVSNEHPFSWRASWTLVHLTESEPGIVEPFIPLMIRDIVHLKADRQIASFFQILTKFEFPAQEAGHLFDLAISILHNTTKQMYFKLYALQFLIKFAEMVPELIPELLLTLEDEDLISQNKYIRKQVMRLKENLTNLN